MQLKLNEESDADSYSITARLRNGLPVTMGISFQYSLRRDPSSLTNLLLNFGEGPNDHKQFFIMYTRELTREVISAYDVYDLWTKRGEIRQAIAVKLNEVLGNHYADLLEIRPANASEESTLPRYSVQLLDLSIPADVQGAIETTTVERQHILQAEKNLEATRVTVQTNLLKARQDATITIINAQASAFATRTAAQAEAQALNVTIEAEAEALASYKGSLDMDNTNVLDLEYVDALINANPGAAVYSIPQPSSIDQLL